MDNKALGNHLDRLETNLVSQSLQTSELVRPRFPENPLLSSRRPASSHPPIHMIVKIWQFYFES